MRTTHWLAVVFLSLSGGVCIGWLLAPETEKPSPEASQTAQVTGEGPKAADKTTAADNTPASNSEQETAPTPVTTLDQPGEGDLIRAIRALPKPEFRLGDGTISGRVIDLQGKPVAGVIVQAQPPRDRPLRQMRILDYEGRDLHTGLEEDIREIFRQRALTAPDALRVESGADGTWQINGIGEGKHSVYARAKGYQIHTPKYEFVAGEYVTVYATPLAELQIQVLKADGQPTTEVRPEIKDVATGTTHGSYVTAEGASWYSPVGEHFAPMVPAGIYMLWVGTPEFTSVEPVLIEMKIGEPRSVTLQLAAGAPAGLSGKILFTGGELPGTRSLAYAIVSAGMYAEDVAAALSTQRMGKLQPLGDEYVLPLVEPGTYVIAVFVDYKFMKWIEVDFQAAGQIQDIELLAPSAADCVVCEIDAPTGQGYNAQFYVQPIERGSAVPLVAWKISEREYRIVPPTETEMAGRFPRTIRVRSSMGEVDIPIVHLAPQRVRAVFKQRSCLIADFGHWVLPAGFDRPLTVALRREDGTDVGQASWYRGGPMPATISNVQPGNYRLFIGVNGLVFTDEPIEVSGSHIVKQVELPVLHHVTIVGLDNYGRTTITGPSIHDEGGMRLHVYQGNSTSIYLPAGDYTCTWRGRNDREDRTTTLTVAGTMTFTLPE